MAMRLFESHKTDGCLSLYQLIMQHSLLLPGFCPLLCYLSCLVLGLSAYC
ncbi:hypothetical protein D322_377 [Yersinia enterocolitica IP 10393]|nr:hypothetical protein D322_377 [Yersinia enterocolitica IP 10393]